jgi:hypothetical protein
MNYYDALRLEDGSGYHYVSKNRREGTHPVGYCSRIQPCPECEDYRQPECEVCGQQGYIDKGEGWYKEHVHATADEARECFRRYLLDGQRDESYGDWTGCEAVIDGEKCDTPTKKGLTGRPPLGNGYAFCDEHRTPEQLEALTPTVGRITASY